MILGCASHELNGEYYNLVTTGVEKTHWVFSTVSHCAISELGIRYNYIRNWDFLLVCA